MLVIQMIGTQQKECLVLQTREPNPIETPVIVQRVEEGKKLKPRDDGLDRLKEELDACIEEGVSYNLVPSYSHMSLRHMGRMASKQAEKRRRERYGRWNR